MVGFFFAPFVSSTMRVEPAWVDDSGHVTTAFTHAMFERALDEAFSCLGLGEVYRHNSEWKFKVLGQGYSRGIAGIAADYGLSL